MLLRHTACLLMVSVLCGCRQSPLAEISSEIETRISSNRIRDHLTFIAQKPHRSGTAQNEEVSRYIATRLSALGFSVTVQESEALLHEPLESALQLISPTSKQFDLKEISFEQDRYSAIAANELPFLSYSPDANLTGELIYANYGDRADYALLKKNGVSVAGKIALVRAQGICRSMKNLIAEEEGVAALLLYPEPRDLGFAKTPFPLGPATNPWAVQRGTLLQTFRQPGDPQRLQDTTTSTLPRIPSLPVSSSVAIELLNNIQGINSPPEWKGWLKSPYSLGSGPAVVQLRFRGQRNVKKIRNVIAKLPFGSAEAPAVLAGTHYDAWVYGASDPSSGVAVLLEAANVLSELGKRGWKPLRPITLAFWDAEEYGMHGSTDWVKRHLSEVPAAIYWNVDTAVRGKDFVAHISPGLRRPLRNLLLYIEDPELQRPLSDLYSVFELPGFTADSAPFTGFQGVPAAEISFGRSYPLYHTLYDDLFWFEQYADPNFGYSAALAKLLTLSLYYWGTEQILPFQFSEIGTFGHHHLAELEQTFPQLAQNAESRVLKAKIREYQQTARSFESARKTHQSTVNPRTNLLLQQAMTSFFTRENRDFATANLLIGPHHLTGCNGEALPALQRALDSRRSVKEELERLRIAYETADSILRQVTTMLQE